MVVHADGADQARLEFEVVDLMSAGRAAELGDWAAALPAEHHTLAALVDGDLRLRTLGIAVPELQALRTAVVADHGESHLWTRWADALLAERLMFDGDILAFVLARQALTDLGPEPVGLEPFLTAYTRARLLRVAATAWLFLPAADALDGHEREHQQALRILSRCGYHHEVAATAGIAAGLRGVTLALDEERNLATMISARGDLGGDGSQWALLLDFMIGVTALGLGRFADARAASVRLAASPVRHERHDTLLAYEPAAARLFDDGPTAGALTALDDVLRGIEHDARFRQVWEHHATSTVADFGQLPTPTMRRLFEFPALGPVDEVHRSLVQARVDVLDGGPPRVSVEGTVEQLLAWGRERYAGFHTVRLAHNLHAAGRLDEAERWYRWGLARLAPPAERSLIQQAWARPLGAPFTPPRPNGRPIPVRSEVRVPAAAATGTGGQMVRVEVLGPQLAVHVDGCPTALSKTQAALLVVLVWHHPAPVHIDTAMDALWPDSADRKVATLNSVVHRLRVQLGGPPATVRRERSMLSLDPRIVSADLWDHRQAVAGSPAERAAALTGVRGNLCAVELPFVEGLIELRHRFRNEWRRMADRAVAEGSVTLDELVPAATGLDLGHDLGP